MIQAIGLTSVPRRNRPPVVDDLTFEARPGRVTVLLGEAGAGKTSTLRLMLRLDPGRGVALFRGRSLDRVAHPVREVGVLLGDVPGHPGRTARGHLRMLSAAAGVPAARADEVLDVVGLSGLADQRIGDFSRGMDRRLGIAAALLGDPHTLVLDEPTAGLSPRETSWLHGLLRGYAAQGGAVLVTSSSPGEAARVGDQVVTIHRGRLVADQETAVFARARLRPRVAVRSPSAARLAHIISAEAEAACPPSEAPPVEVVHEGGSALAVYGSSCAAVGETAYRHGILVHRLAEEVEAGPVPPLQRADGRRPADAATAPDAPAGVPAAHGRDAPEGPLSRVQPPLPAPGPAWPLRYELHRIAGVRTGWVVVATTLLLSLLASVLLARAGAPEPGLLAGWPAPLPLPPAALGAGVLGALAFGQEYRYPALAPDAGGVPRRLALLGGKLTVTAAAALLLALSSVVLDAVVVRLLFGRSVTLFPDAWPGALAGWIALALGCAWAGLLGAGLFRSTLLGLVAVLVVPTLVVPVVNAVLARPAARSLAGLPGRLRSSAPLQWPAGMDEGVSTALRLVSQPVGWALVLSLTGLLGAYVLTVFRGRPR
ncbi:MULTISPECIES: ABC transporter ATP-binding protein [Streptomyces]|uniref:ABC transporter ATP-binding protein n=1 Tax=Streptomyces TaxID=1883 RepID=UPI00163BAA25|nr:MULTISPECIES: ATP-binding cassette domain-containing protein [Streptomyces]MBC2876775.1 ATP-binding cassette domain-containing protein [Streptomyces sp. TYQ1024]UBI36400.1 ATP-binding cassette domain-containing protein [Streptomyces mobaraensis]UKW28993.1 ATP-binding cassette domain-containing protein [Streptomyces sp. TYQ1024]